MYLKYNIIMCSTMAMFKINPNAGFPIKFLFYFWRIICNLGVFSVVILSILEIIDNEMMEIDEVAVGITHSVIFFCSAIRINYFYLREDKLESLVNSMNILFKRETSTGLEEKSTKSYENLIRIMVKVWSFCVFFTGQFLALLPLLFEDTRGRVLPLSLWYPFNSKESPYYELTYLSQILTQFFMGFSYGNSDLFFACIALAVTSQFELLGWELKNLIYTTLLKQNLDKQIVLEFKKNVEEMKENEINEEILSIISTKKFKIDLRASLHSCIEFHQMILKVSAEMQDFFSPMLLPVMLSCISYLIFIMYSLVVSGSKIMIVIPLWEYMLMTYVQTFGLTFMGQQLYSMSESVLDSLYDMPWYLCDNNFKKSLHIMQSKLLKPTVITAWKFFEMTFATFLFVIKTSFSYWAFLKQVTNK